MLLVQIALGFLGKNRRWAGRDRSPRSRRRSGMVDSPARSHACRAAYRQRACASGKRCHFVRRNRAPRSQTVDGRLPTLRDSRWSKGDPVSGCGSIDGRERSDRVRWAPRRGKEWVVREFDAAGASVGALDSSPPSWTLYRAVARMASLCIRDADLILQEMLTRR